MPLIECVPNVSEGRRADVIAALGAAIAGPGMHMLDRSSDPSHNRTVYTFAGEPAPIRDAVLRLFAAAVDAIDLRAHDGVHPRIGAVDVVPFVPLQGATMEECVALARSTAALVAERLHVPVFLYEEAAATDERRSLSNIRRGGVNGVALRMKQSAWRPDFGPDQPHPTAGATAIGARPILIAYNVNLASNRLGVAKRIASAIRASSGGLRPRQSSGHAARPWHRPGVDEPDELQRDVDDHGVRCDDARSRGRWRARAGERDRRAGARGCAASRSSAPTEVTGKDLDKVLERRLENEQRRPKNE